MLIFSTATGSSTRVAIEPAMRAIVTWNARHAADALELTVHRMDNRASLALPYVAFDTAHRASLDGFDDVAAIATDVVSATRPIVAIDIISQLPLDRVGVSTPPARDDRTVSRGYVRAVELPVPEFSQYVPAYPDERGWCAPASIAMMLATWGLHRDVARVARGIYDDAYHGTGNWAFAAAYAGTLGFAGTAAYLRNLATVEGFVASGIPVATSIAWAPGELPGASLPTSSGHIVVVRGFDAFGDPIVNDPAQPSVRQVYPRGPFERAWIDHGGVALLVAPEGRIDDIRRCANA